MPDPSKIMQSFPPPPRSVPAPSISVPSAWSIDWDPRLGLSLEGDHSFSGGPSFPSGSFNGRHHPYTCSQPSSRFYGDDKKNVAITGHDFIARLCLDDCWQSATLNRESVARDALLTANKLTSAQGRSETLESAPVLSSVSTCAFSFRETS